MLHVCDAQTILDCFLNNNNKLNTVLGFQTEVCYLQASGPLLLPLALGHLPVISSPSLLLTTTRQYSLEETNHNIKILKTTKSMTVILWILSQWYAQRDYNCVIITVQMNGRNKLI